MKDNCPQPATPTGSYIMMSPTMIQWVWDAVPGATGYKWNTQDDYGSATDLGTLTSFTEDNLFCQTLYTRYVWAYSACGVSNPGILNGMTEPCPLPEVITFAITSITQTTAMGGGNVSSDGGSPVWARGICWSTATMPTIAGNHTTDGGGSGNFSSTLSGLSANTIYYVRAYATNNGGTAYGNEVTFVTPSWTCGTSNTINHSAGVVVPVTKSTVYGTVNNIPGETTKCWITSNLGSDHQATAVNDATEPSAGWYWQFNRKQGYMHDGTNRIPNTTWITSISESSDWQTANDPCAIELGAGWRIPTYAEWNNADVSGGWGSWIATWNSNLKIHAGGDLSGGGGLLSGRGVNGRYYSSTASSVATAWALSTNSSNCYLESGFSKTNGFNLRCIRSVISVPTVTTSPISNFTANSATSGGNVTADGGATVNARGVCWSTSPDPTILDPHTTDGSGTGSYTSALTGLTANTLYYVRAYATSGYGTGYGSTLTFTPQTWSCGSTFTVSHVVGNAAPVAKTVIYGTTGSVAGEPTKCWITSNLGADRQATAVNESNEAPAGWYWQFNRLQGYKHDGANRTPNTTWITSINESTDWQTQTDPCVVELGNGWRIPTLTEWNNVDAGGSWTNWNGPWGSNLKMHAAGYLYKGTGNLDGRGLYGLSWGANKSDNTNGYFLAFGSGYSNTDATDKAHALPLRCVRNLCNTSFTVVHSAGAVAPVTKTVSYSSVNNIPGETSKCWITSNLGANGQATSVSDATEASAGWYWQFNRKQGYKHDGSTVTPSWTITSINENSDWLTANDPCSFLIGGGWRLPTTTEWSNMTAAGTWTNWTGPWSSALKLHAAGYLDQNSFLNLRGSWGLYRTSNQQSNYTNAYFLLFNAGQCYNGADNKAFGIPVRCIHD